MLQVSVFELLTQRWAKYGLLLYKQYTLVACVTSVATDAKMEMTGY